MSTDGAMVRNRINRTADNVSSGVLTIKQVSTKTDEILEIKEQNSDIRFFGNQMHYALYISEDEPTLSVLELSYEDRENRIAKSEAIDQHNRRIEGLEAELRRAENDFENAVRDVNNAEFIGKVAIEVRTIKKELEELQALEELEYSSGVTYLSVDIKENERSLIRWRNCRYIVEWLPERIFRTETEQESRKKFTIHGILTYDRLRQRGLLAHLVNCPDNGVEFAVNTVEPNVQRIADTWARIAGYSRCVKFDYYNDNQVSSTELLYCSTLDNHTLNYGSFGANNQYPRVYNLECVL